MRRRIRSSESLPVNDPVTLPADEPRLIMGQPLTGYVRTETDDLVRAVPPPDTDHQRGSFNVPVIMIVYTMMGWVAFLYFWASGQFR